MRRIRDDQFERRLVEDPTIMLIHLPDSQAVLLTSGWGDWTAGSFTIIDLVAAATNAFNAALISRRPDHWKHYTIVGIILLAVTRRFGSTGRSRNRGSRQN